MWLSLGLKLVPIIMGAIRTVENTSTKKGEDKRTDALQTIDAFVSSLEGSCNATVTQVGDVRDAVKKVIDALVELQNVIAKNARA